MSSPEIFMRRAIALSCESVAAGSGGPFGAVIVQDGRIVAEGCNQVTSTNDPTAHAEVVAIRAACRALGRFELRGCEIFTSCEPLPDVPRGDLLGAAGAHQLRQRSRRRGRHRLR